MKSTPLHPPSPQFGLRMIGMVPDPMRIARLAAPVLDRSVADINQTLDDSGHLVVGLSHDKADELLAALGGLGLEVLVETMSGAETESDEAFTDPLEGLSVLSRHIVDGPRTNPGYAHTLGGYADLADRYTDPPAEEPDAFEADAPASNALDDEPTTVFDVDPLNIDAMLDAVSGPPPLADPSDGPPPLRPATSVPPPFVHPEALAVTPPGAPHARETVRQQVESKRGWRSSVWGVVLVGLVMAAGATYALVNRAPDPLELLAKARTASQAGQYQDALIHLSNARAAGAPASLVGDMEREAQIGPLADAGRMHLLAGRFDEAHSVLVAAESLAPQSPKLLTLRVQLQRSRASAQAK